MFAQRVQTLGLSRLRHETISHRKCPASEIQFLRPSRVLAPPERVKRSPSKHFGLLEAATRYFDQTRIRQPPLKGNTRILTRKAIHHRKQEFRLVFRT